MQNPHTVDLLVSLAYVSAAEGAMEDPLPIGMGLRVPFPEGSVAPVPQPNIYQIVSFVSPVEVPTDPEPGPDGLIYFDDLSRFQV